MINPTQEDVFQEFSTPQPDILLDQGLGAFDFPDIAAAGIAHTPNFFNDLNNSLNEALEEQNSVGGCACCSCESQRADEKTILVELLG